MNNINKTKKYTYQKIKDILAQMILKGELTVGDRLPPIRELAQRFDCNFHTVRKGIASLAKTGVIESRAGSGVYVKQIPGEFFSLNGSPQYVIGLDAGGSKTMAILADETGHVLARVRSGPGVLNRYADPNAGITIISAIKDLFQEFGAVPMVSAVFLNMGGFVDPELVAEIKNVTGTDCVAFDRESSGYLVSVCAPFWKFAIAIMSGTGSVAVATAPEGDMLSTGGWGYIIDDRGSGYALGKYGLRAVSDFIDGRGEWTELVPLLLSSEHICNDSQVCMKIKTLNQRQAEANIDNLKVVLKNYLKKIDRSSTASLAPLVEQAARNGDQIAVKIFNAAGAYLAELAAALGKKLKPDIPSGNITAVGIGGLFNAGELINRPFREKIESIAPDIHLAETDFSLAHGAVLCALKTAKIPLNDQIVENIRSSY